ncbi:MAG TPA: BadF/BadG/BcrA/BcrD ATPase family protein [Gaiellaceae bacterium]|nr:BadF/BadG/BcrA/BcrD ATPase family protein [Gaiellaceae bacterium]
MRHAIAVDGGNSKTDVALVREDGEVVGTARGGGSSPHHLGLDGALAVIEALLEKAAVRVPADVAELLLAGVDFPVEEEVARRAIEQRGWAARVSVDNDTYAVLRAGTDAGWGVAVVCGAGMNCVGVAPDGREARFPALGWTTGDWGGGSDVGREAVWAAARSEDGRGPKTVLERMVPAHFGLGTPSELAEAIHFGRIAGARTIDLAPIVFSAAADDPVARGIVDRLADEVVALARVAILRLGLEEEPVQVLLGGGLLRNAGPQLLDAIGRGLAGVGPAITARATAAPAILGAALLALDALGAAPEAYDRVRIRLAADAAGPVVVGGGEDV